MEKMKKKKMQNICQKIMKKEDKMAWEKKKKPFVSFGEVIL